MAFAPGFVQRPFDQRVPDSTLTKRRLDSEWAEQEAFARANANGGKPHRSDKKRADPGGERKLAPMRYGLAQPISRFGVAARSKSALVQPFDSGSFFLGFG